MTSIDFSEAIEDCSVVADSCSFIAQPNKFAIHAKGSLNAFKSEYSSDEANIQSQTSKSKYSLEYLQKMVKACKLTEKTTINFATDSGVRNLFCAKKSSNIAFAGNTFSSVVHNNCCMGVKMDRFILLFNIRNNFSSICFLSNICG